MTSPQSDRLSHLEKSNEALRAENAQLKDENFKLSTELEILKKINENLKEKMSSVDLIESPAKLKRSASLNVKLDLNINSAMFSKLNEINEDMKEDRSNDSKSSISQKDQDMIDLLLSSETTQDRSYLEAVPDLMQMKSKSDIIQVAGVDEEVKLKGRTYSIEATPSPEKKLTESERVIQAMTENPDFLYEHNHIMRLPPHSPFSKLKIYKVEKQLDGTETILQKWNKSLKDVNAACQGYVKSMEAFVNQLLLDRSFFSENKEIQRLVGLVAQFYKENSTNFEVLTKVINNAIVGPFRKLYNGVLPAYKDSKKKVQKAREEMEAAELKYLALKRSMMIKDPLGNQGGLKTYVNALRNFQLCRLDYVQTLNDINMTFNLEFINRMCVIFTSKTDYLNSSFDLIAGMEEKIQAYSNSVEKKKEIYGELSEEFKRLRAEIERNVFVPYPISLTKNVIKEGYLFIKCETKDFKKRYCIIQENGMLCWAKEPANSHEEPRLKEIADIKFCKVKENTELDLTFCFELVNAMTKKPIVFRADSEFSMNEWITAIQTHIETVLFKSPNTKGISSPKKGKQTTRFDNSGPSQIEPEDTPLGKAKQALIDKILHQNVCADCGAQTPSWLSLNLGTIICLDCSGIHRSLGPSISKVRSFKLDNLSLPVLELFSALPTAEVNKVWERNPEEVAAVKPSPEAEKEKREIFIKKKYVEKAFVKTIPNEDHLTVMSDGLKEKDIFKVLNVIACGKLNLNALHKIGNKKMGVLHYACWHSSKDIVELLIRNGCNLDLGDQDLCRPLDYSMLGNNIDVMEYLINKIDEKEK